MTLVMPVSSGETPHRRSCRTTLRRSLVTSPDVSRGSHCGPTSVSCAPRSVREAPIPPPGSTPDPILTEARWAVLRTVTPVGLPRTISAVPTYPVYHRVEREAEHPRGSWTTSSHESDTADAAPRNS